ncbi:MAG: 3',5'-cyclic-nucleotide phosphodiesterase [Gammaproteobacteria bacterium]|nr:3',5'-cyclic-nucleotide phosphodiesterase [Gammaproteobacteria bacterium]
MKLRILGCSGGIGPGRRTTSLLINDNILIDAGSGVGDLTLEEMSRIEHIFITHSHMDHIAFLPLMVDSIFSDITTPITIHAQAVTIQALKEHIFNWIIWPDFSKLPNPRNAVMQFQPMAPDETLLVDNVLFQMIEVSHTVPAVSYRVEEDGKSFAFSGDTSSNDNLWNRLNAYPSLDVLIVESAFTDDYYDLALASRHYTPSLLLEDIKKLRHSPEVYLTHFKPGAEMEIASEFTKLDPNFKYKILQNGTSFTL